jgi:hypothetical protein
MTNQHMRHRGDGLRMVPIKHATAKAFVRMWHRTHDTPSAGAIFVLGVANADDKLVGVAMVGRPVAVEYQDGLTAEVTRTATDGTFNCNSMLYGAAWRVAKAMGYWRLITYTQEGETGASLRAAGYRIVAQRKPRKGWDSPSRPRDDHGVDHIARTLWEAV